MRNNYLLGLGGALLASTALTTGASAGTIHTSTGVTIVNGVSPVLTTLAAQRVAAQSTITAATTIGSATHSLLFSFTNTYTKGLAPKIILSITGGNFHSTSLASSNAANAVLSSPGANDAFTTAGTASGSGANCAVGILSTQVQLTGCLVGSNHTNGANTNASFTMNVLGLSGLIYTAATGLTTAGTSIAVSGTVADGNNQTNTYETITSANVVTSVNAAIPVVGTSAVTVAAGTGATPFVSVTGGLVAPTAGLTAVLAQITYTGTGAVSTTFTALEVTNAVGALALTVTSPALADPAISNVRFVSSTGASLATSTTLTSTATFANTALINTGGALVSAFTAGNQTNTVQIEYNGTTGISGGAAGTVAGTFSAVATFATGLPALSGATSAVNRAGFTAGVNSVQSSTNTAVTSYIRITNSGAAAGAVTITPYNDMTGAALGTAFTTASINGNATLQLNAAQIEGSAGINPATSGATSYSLRMTGPLSAYVQHVTGNVGGAAGVFTDFSGRRTNVGGDATNGQ